MMMLKSKKLLLIDKACPVSKLFGKSLSSLNCIDRQSICYYQTVTYPLPFQIDMERAKDEVAFFDYSTAQTAYGLNALIAVVSKKNGAVKSLLHFPPIYFLLNIIYWLIAYNREVFYPVVFSKNERVCQPSKNSIFRWAYLLGVALFTGLVLNNYIFYINHSFGFEHDWLREYYICFGQLFWQLVAILLIDRSKTLTYLGNMSTVSLLGGFLLLPLLLINYIIPLSPIVLLVAFIAVVSFMFFEHIRRCKILHLSLWMTCSWLAYRTVVLGLIIWVTGLSS